MRGRNASTELVGTTWGDERLNRLPIDGDHVAAAMRAIRERAGLSRVQAAAAYADHIGLEVETAVSRIEKWENGKTGATLAYAALYFEALGYCLILEPAK